METLAVYNLIICWRLLRASGLACNGKIEFVIGDAGSQTTIPIVCSWKYEPRVYTYKTLNTF